MTVEIRPIVPDEMHEMVRIASLALAEPADESWSMRPEWTLCAFEDGKMTTTMGAWPFTMSFNGDDVPVSGITAVGTLPIYRRRGYLRQIMTTHFQRLHEEGERPIAILYASWAAIYQRFGYAVVATQHAYHVEPRYLQFCQPHATPGRLRELKKDDPADLETLVELYRQFRAPRIGYIHRVKERWEKGVLTPWPEKGHLSILLYEEDSVPLGYVVYTAHDEWHDSPPGAWQGLGIRELVWLNPAAYRALWHCLGHMDAVREIVWRSVPTDDPLRHLLLEPRMLRVTAWDDILARLVDVAKALPARHYATEAALTFEILDDLCPWNAGRWRLETFGAETTLARTDQSPQVTVPVSTLAMLAFGQITATEAYRMGRLEAHDLRALPQWDAAFRTEYRAFCADGF